VGPDFGFEAIRPHIPRETKDLCDEILGQRLHSGRVDDLE
jgi:hypothetical protein